MENSIMVIHPYLDRGVWVFDDEATSLIKEAFVAGADELCDYINFLTGANDEFTAFFSAIPFPGWKIKLDIVVAGDDGQLGTFYNWRETDWKEEWKSKTLWLCPSLLKFFKVPPKEIYLNYK